MPVENGSAELQLESERRELARVQRIRTDDEIAETKSRELKQNALKYAADKIDREEYAERQRRKAEAHAMRQAAKHKRAAEW